MSVRSAAGRRRQVHRTVILTRPGIVQTRWKTDTTRWRDFEHGFKTKRWWDDHPAKRSVQPRDKRTRNTMKLKLRVARWIARRIATRSRIARRALRDYQRQECSRIRRDERRTRGLRLYIAWSQAMHDRRANRMASRPSASGAMSMQVNRPQTAH